MWWSTLTTPTKTGSPFHICFSSPLVIQNLLRATLFTLVVRRKSCFHWNSFWWAVESIIHFSIFFSSFDSFNAKFLLIFIAWNSLVLLFCELTFIFYLNIKIRISRAHEVQFFNNETLLLLFIDFSVNFFSINNLIVWLVYLIKNLSNMFDNNCFQIDLLLFLLLIKRNIWLIFCENIFFHL